MAASEYETHPHLGAGSINRVALHKTQHQRRKWWVASMVEYCHVLRREGIGEPSALGWKFVDLVRQCTKDKRRAVQHRVHSPAPQCVSNGRSVPP